MDDATFSMNLWRLRIGMTPQFTAGGGQLEYVTVNIYEGEMIIKSFVLKDDPVPVNTQENKVSKEVHDADVDGKMYLDYYKQKIIFEGHCSEKEQPNILSNFWLEIVPNYMFFNGQGVLTSTPDCSKHPLSISSLSFAIDPVKDYIATAIPDNEYSQNIFKVSVFQEVKNQTRGDDPGKVPYLSAILCPNMKLQGIDTSSMKHDVDFKGDVGFLETGTRIFIDGDITANNTICCSLYIELH